MSKKSQNWLLYIFVFAMLAVFSAGVYYLLISGSLKFNETNQAAPVQVTGARVMFSVGDVTVKRTTGITGPLAAGDTVGRDDVITSAKNSFAVLQVDETGTFRINENTIFSFSRIKDAGDTEAKLETGSVYSKLNKIKKGESCRINSVTYVASVRGTEFLSSYLEGKGEVSVLDGKVLVEAVAKKLEEKIVESGTGYSITDDKIETFRLTERNILLLKKFALYDYILNLNNKSEAEMKQIFEEIMLKEKEIDAKIKELDKPEPGIKPLDRLRKAGKPLAMIYTRDGSQLAGHVVSQDGVNMNLDTGEGVITIPVKTIIRRIPIK